MKKKRKISFLNEDSGKHIVMECVGNIFQALMIAVASGTHISHVTIKQY